MVSFEYVINELKLNVSRNAESSEILNGFSRNMKKLFAFENQISNNTEMQKMVDEVTDSVIRKLEKLSDINYNEEWVQKLLEEQEESEISGEQRLEFVMNLQNIRMGDDGAEDQELYDETNPEHQIKKMFSMVVVIKSWF